MSVALLDALAVISGVEFLIGILSNGFIVLVNFIDWVQRRRISMVDQILTALAVSRITLLWLALVNWYVYVLSSGEWATEALSRFLYNTWTVISHFSLWLATSLSIVYLLKIANFSKTLFLYLKIRVKKVVKVTLLVSLVLLCLSIVVTNTHIDVLIDERKMCNRFSSNSTRLSTTFLLVNTLCTFTPFAVSMVTFLLLIFSLWRHLKNMQLGSPGCRDASTTAHIRALHTLVVSLLFYFLFLLSLVVHVWSTLLLEEKLIVLFSQAVRTSFPSGHSCVLILGNTKLRRASLSVLWWLRCRSCSAAGRLGPQPGGSPSARRLAYSRGKSGHSKFPHS